MLSVNVGDLINSFYISINLVPIVLIFFQNLLWPLSIVLVTKLTQIRHSENISFRTIRLSIEELAPYYKSNDCTIKCGILCDIMEIKVLHAVNSFTVLRLFRTFSMRTSASQCFLIIWIVVSYDRLETTLMFIAIGKWHQLK